MLALLVLQVIQQLGIRKTPLKHVRSWFLSWGFCVIVFKFCFYVWIESSRHLPSKLSSTWDAGIRFSTPAYIYTTLWVGCGMGEYLGGCVGWVDGWLLSWRGMGALISSFHAYLAHVKVFTWKIKAEGGGLRKFVFGLWFFVIWGDRERGKKALLFYYFHFTTNTCQRSREELH